MEEKMDVEMEFSDSEVLHTVTQGHATPVSACDPASSLTAQGNLTSTSEKGKEDSEHLLLPGYIFTCNGKTKLECYRYRVFGLPKGRKHVVENIKPGMKLFLYDFERKLLYGIYEATTGGKLNIELDAFDGMYPAQVGFRIYKHCYPLLESSFKSAIQDNYTGVKFKQELSARQVVSLLSLFRSFTTPELESMSPGLVSANSPTARKLSGLENNQFNPQMRSLPFEEQYVARGQLRHTPSILDRQFVRHVEPWDYAHGESLPSQMVPRHAAYAAYSLQHSYQGQTGHIQAPIVLPAMSNLVQKYYLSAAEQQRLLGDPSSQLSMQDPYHKYLSVLSDIRRYGAAQEPISSNQLSTSANEYHPSTSSGNRNYPSFSSGNDHNPSMVLGNEYNPSTSQTAIETVRQPEISSVYYYDHQIPRAQNATESMQSHAGAIGNTQHVEAIGYAPQQSAETIGGATKSHSELSAYAPQSYPEAIYYAPQSHPEALGYAPQSHPEAIGHAPQSDASAVGYAAQSQASAVGYAPQSHASAVGYAPQSHASAVGYAPQSHASAVGYAPQSHASAVGYAPQSYAGATGYAAETYAGAVGYAAQSHAGALGYTPQSHAVALGYAPPSYPEANEYATQSFQSHAAVLEPSGTTNGNVSNLCYSYTSGGTASYNQTS